MAHVFAQPVTLRRPRQTVPAISPARWSIDAIEALLERLGMTRSAPEAHA